MGRYIKGREMKGLASRILVFAMASVCMLMFDTLAFAAEYYAAPNGTSNGKGTIALPWDIATALQSSKVRGGDTVWLRGGTYGTGGPLVYECSLSGRNDSQPVIVRQYRDEHAQVNGAITVSGSNVWFWGFELTNLNPQRAVSNIDTERPRGIVISAKSVGVKIINMAIHDVGRGGVGGGGNNFEVYGTLFWGNGIDDGSGFRGDAMYVNLWHQPPAPGVTNVIRDNIAFRNFYAGFKVYSEWQDVYMTGTTSRVTSPSTTAPVPLNTKPRVIFSYARKKLVHRFGGCAWWTITPIGHPTAPILTTQSLDASRLRARSAKMP